MSTDRICDCCTGVGAETPAILNNRPGLSAIAYRVGGWAQFKASMLNALSTTPELAALHTRSDDDFTIALLDAWAVACDILTFYQERIANEGYLRTATERLSIGELAKLIGYKLDPGVAARAALAFVMDQPVALPKLPAGMLLPAIQTNAVPTQIELDVGIKVQSVPGPGQQPATYETIAAIEARAAWNAIRPRMTRPVDPRGANARANIRLQGLHGELQVGDPLLLIADDGMKNVQRISAVIPDNDAQTTSVQFEAGSAQQPRGFPTVAGVIQPTQHSLNDKVIWNSIKGFVWQDQNDLVAIATKLSWSIDALESGINALRGAIAPGTNPPLRAFALKTRAALFGNNAPDYRTISPTLTHATSILNVGSDGKATGSYTFIPAPYPISWEGRTLYSDATFGHDPSHDPTFDLDNVYPSLVAGSYMVLLSPDGSVPFVAATISSARQASRADYLLTGKVTRVTLNGHRHEIVGFYIRTTVVLGQSVELPVGEVPIDEVVDNTKPLMLDGAYLSLKVGQLVAISGERTDKAGETMSEVSTIASLSLVDGYTALRLDPELAGSYVRGTVTFNANVAPATHGETRSEILGSGDATQPFQRFALKQPPLTYISASTPSGSRSTLLVRVNGIQWTEVPWLSGHEPGERIFTLITDQAGTVWVQFGDGTSAGARLPSGTNNVMATYRQGLGTAGMVGPSKLSMLLSRPLGLKDVSNPLAGTGGGDPETIDDARANAPITVRTLDRTVSLVDFEDFARASAGIAKANVTWTSDGTRDLACVTVAGAGGAHIVAGTPQYKNLINAMQLAGDGTALVALRDYTAVTFAIAATITPDPLRDGPTVLAAVRAALQRNFSFGARDIMQPVFRSEVIAVMQEVPGVVALTHVGLARSGAPLFGAQPDALVAAAPALGPNGLVGAELLTLQSGPLTHVVLAS